MDSEQIKYFLQVAQDLNFTKASENLFVSQSTVSKKISSLEEELNVTLFKRNNRNVDITQEGEHLCEFFKRFESEFFDELEYIKLLKNKSEKTISIGVIFDYDLNEYFAKFKNCSFNNFLVDFDKIDNLLHGLSKGEYDIVIGQYLGIQQEINNSKLSGLRCEFLKNVNRMVYYSVDNPLAQKENLKIADFKDQPFYIGKSLVAYQNASEIAEKEGFLPVFVPTLHSFTRQYKIRTGIGFSICDECSSILRDRAFASFKINHQSKMGCCYKENINGIKENYIKEIIACFK